MAEFCDCPQCKNDYDARESCTLCGGTGARLLTQDSVELAEGAKEWLDDKIDILFSDWAKIAGFHPAYGVEGYEIGYVDIQIIQDTSCMGCHSSQQHTLPAAWLYAQGEERLEMMRVKLRADAEEKAAKLHAQRAAKAAEAAETRKDRRAKLLAELAKIDNEEGLSDGC